MNQHAIDNASTDTLLSSYIKCLTETQLVPIQNTVNIENPLSNFSVIYNSSEIQKYGILSCTSVICGDLKLHEHGRYVNIYNQERNI